MDELSLSVSGQDSPGLSDLETTLDRNIHNILSLLESPSGSAEKPTNEQRPAEILKDVTAYVEVRTGPENRSRAVMKELALLGATVVTKFTDEVTHVIFKEGKKSTKTRAIKRGVHLLSVLWLESCKQSRCRAPEQQYGIHIEEKSTPIFGHKWRKCKSMQPKDFEEEVVRSAERGLKRRKRGDKWKQFDSPAGSPRPKHWFVAETQPRSPSELRIFSPSLTIPDTPPSMRRKLEELRRKRNMSPSSDTDSDEHERSPSPSDSQSSTIALQRRLFNPNAVEEGEPSSPAISPIPATRVERNSLSEPLSPSQGDTPANLEPQPSEVIDNRTALKKTATDDDSISSNLENPKKLTRKTSGKSDGSISPNPENPKKLTRKTSAGKRRLLSKNVNLDTSKLIEPVIVPSDTAQSKLATSGEQKGKKVRVLTSSDGEGSHMKSGSDVGKKPSTKQSRRKSVCISELPTTESGIKRVNSAPAISSQASEPKVLRRRSTRILPAGITPLIEVTECEPQPKQRRKSVAVCPVQDETTAAVAVKTQRLKSVRVSKTSLETLHEGKPSSDASSVNDVAEDAVTAVSKAGNTTSPQGKSVSRRKSMRRSSVAMANKCPADYDSTMDESGLGELAARRKKVGNAARKRKKGDTTSSENESAAGMANASVYDSTAYNTVLNLTKSRPSIAEFSTTTQSKPKKKKPRQITPSDPDEDGVAARSGVHRKASTSRPRKDSEAQKSGSDTDRRRWKKVSVSEDNEDTMHATRTLVTTSLHTAEQETVQSIVHKLGGFRLVDTVADSTTHVVCGEKRRTLNVLNAIARGCWFLSLEWVFKSLEANKWLEEEPYELTSFLAAKSTRQQRTDTVGLYKMQLFTDQGDIFVSPNSKPPQRDLAQLITVCGGQVTKNIRKADMCIGHGSRGSVAAVSEQWVLDSITSNKCLPVAKYRLLLKEDGGSSSSEY